MARNTVYSEPVDENGLIETNNGIDKSINDSTSTSVTSPPNKKKMFPTLKQLKLPYQKRYSGRPPTSKASHFADYTKAPKSFLFKNTSEKNKMFLCWFIGFEKILKGTRKIEEEEIISIPENVSNAIIVEIIFSSNFCNCFLRELEIFLMIFWKTGFRQLRERPFSFISW
jgi:hypothetical protein